MIFFRRRFLVGSFAPILASKQTLLTNMVNIVPLDQLLPYSSRRVTVTFAYTDNRGEHANRAKSRCFSVPRPPICVNRRKGTRSAPRRGKRLSPGFQTGFNPG